MPLLGDISYVCILLLSASVLFASILKFAQGARFKTQEKEVIVLATWQIPASMGKMYIWKDIIVRILLNTTCTMMHMSGIMAAGGALNLIYVFCTIFSSFGLADTFE